LFHNGPTAQNSARNGGKSDEDRYQCGKQVRESVLGQAHAARTAKNRSSFNAEFQDFLMEYAYT
jgi:hypothetical protein